MGIQNLSLHDLGLQQVRLPLPFKLNHINCYLSEGPNGWDIIDAGLGDDATRGAWEKTFLENGIEASDIQRIYLTHHHPDHYGFLGELQKWTGAEVYASEQSKRQAHNNWTNERLDEMKLNYLRSGIPEHLVQKMDSIGRQFTQWVTPHATIDHVIEEGDAFRFGELTYKTIHTPGHAKGHMALWNEEHKVMIGGDQVLSKITPNISYQLTGHHDNPLQDYLNSLQDIKRLGVELFIPGHGQPFTNIEERIDFITRHHHERLNVVLELLAKSSEALSAGTDTVNKTAYEISDHLFFRKLDAYEMRPGIGEALAHLQYLVHTEDIRMKEEQGLLYFALNK